MKAVFVADIHGSVFYARRVLEIFEESGADYLWILGDILYCGGWREPEEYKNSACRAYGRSFAPSGKFTV